MAAETVKRKAPFVVSKPILLLGLTAFFTDMASEIIYPLLPIFLTAVVGASPMFVGLVEGVAESTASLAKYAFGWWSDRVGKRARFVVGGYTLANLVRPLIGVATAPWHVLFFRFTDRMGKGMRAAARDAWISDLVSPEVRGRAFGFDRAMDHAGAVAGPVIASAFLFFYPGHYRTIFLWSVVPGLAALACIFAARRLKQTAPAPVAAATASAAGMVVMPPEYLSYLGILFLFALSSSSDAFLLLKLSDAGVDARLIPLLWAGLHVVKSGFSLVGGRMADHMGKTTAIVAGRIWYALIYLAFGFTHTPAVAILVFLAYGLYYGLTESAERAMVAGLVPAQARGRAFGLYSFIEGLAALPASLLFGFLWKTQGPAVAFTVSASISIVAAALLIVWRSRQPAR